MTLLWIGAEAEVDRTHVGGKAFSLHRMQGLGLPVPAAFVLTADHCAKYREAGNALDETCIASVREAVLELERRTGKRFGGPGRPLLVSVRSGAAQSMPGMMDTILDLGINDEVEAQLAGASGDADYAADTHRRFREQFENVVGTPPPSDPWEQLFQAVSAVFGSWMSPRAVSYRRHHNIGEDGGTAVTVQAMVFGNLDDDSGTGVLFSRNPLTGDPEPYGEWLPRGQGEDVVSGRHDPLPLSALARQQPAVYTALIEAARTLERLSKDVQDIEFTVESGSLWLLQTRSAKRSPDAAFRLAVSLHDDGVLSEDETLLRVTPEQATAMLRPRVSPEARAAATVLAKGEPACPGVASGQVVFDSDQAEDIADTGVDVVLARPTTDPNDVAGMIASVAVITEIGGSTAHAAVVGRELGLPCVVGCGTGTFAGLEGRTVTVDGTAGEIYDGVLPLAPSSESDNPYLSRIAGWARERVEDPCAPLPDVIRDARKAVESGRTAAHRVGA